MAWIEIVTVIALLQYIVFGALVGRARGKYGVSAPAVTGHEMFERYYRVQMNTLELLAVFLPALWLAARHWSPAVMAAIGMVFVVGRTVYLRSYTTDPASRSLGFGLSIGPTVILLIAGLIGALLAATS
ncbi:MAG: MAPEG family protein [Aquabacterium sp.]|uniref:MAPEG family protein n=1 Tax=Aquabacterium sp. TaxID=1872578 RepID=UPI00120F1CD2|nr:MAPEG family protein [Aquabacterium sp.]TAK99311.1 MAG: MAPEG family protein [Aquabacterium sp.]